MRRREFITLLSRRGSLAACGGRVDHWLKIR